MNQTNYEKVLDEKLPEEERQAAFNERREWLDDLPCGPNASDQPQINNMVDNFGKLAVIAPKQHRVSEDFPSVMQVGSLPT